MSSLVEIGAIAAAVGYVIAGQVRGQPLQTRRLVALPVALVVMGMAGLAGISGFRAADGACIVGSALIAAAIGFGQGAMTIVQSRNGVLWGKLPARGLWLWAALILSRLAITGLAHLLGAEAAASMDSVILVLGINRLAQAGVIAARAMRSGLPLTQ